MNGKSRYALFSGFKLSIIGMGLVFMMSLMIHILPTFLQVTDGSNLAWILNPILLLIYGEIKSIYPSVAQWYWAVCEPIIYLKWYAVGFIVEVVLWHEIHFG